MEFEGDSEQHSSVVHPHLRQRGPAAPRAVADLGAQLRTVRRVVRAAAECGRAGHHRGRGVQVSAPGQPGPRPASSAGAVRRRGGRAQLARRFLAVPIPGPPRPDRTQRELFLPVQGSGAGAGGTGGRTRRRSGRLQTTARRGTHPADRPTWTAALDGATEVPVLHHPHTRPGAGHGPRAVLRGMARTVPGPPHRRFLPRQRVPHGGTRPGRATEPACRSHGRPARDHEGRCGAGPDGHGRRPPDHQGPSGVGRQSAGATSLRPRQRGRARRDRDRAVLPVPGGFLAQGHQGCLRPAAARRQRQPVVRQGRVPGRLRRRHGRYQCGALLPGRDHDPQLRRHAAAPCARGRARVAGIIRRGCDRIRARRRPARGCPGSGHVVRGARRRNGHHYPMVRGLRGEPDQAAGHVT